MRKAEIVIVGGGIAGLTAANALQQAGFGARVPEIASSGPLSTSSAWARLGKRRMKPRSSSAEISRCTPDLLLRSSASFISSKEGEIPVASSFC